MLYLTFSIKKWGKNCVSVSQMYLQIHTCIILKNACMSTQFYILNQNKSNIVTQVTKAIFRGQTLLH